MRRLGGHQEIGIECRIIAASNVAIEQAVADGSFRADLFYRLNVLRLDIPPLRERRDDVEVLARHFLSEMSLHHHGTLKQLAPDTLQLLRAHAWPGNVRELKNVIERACVVSGSSARVEHTHLSIQRRVSRMTGLTGAPLAGEIEVPLAGKSLRDIEREAVHLTLRATGGNQSKAARLLGISRPTLARIMREGTQAPLRLVERLLVCRASAAAAAAAAAAATPASDSVCLLALVGAHRFGIGVDKPTDFIEVAE